MRNVELLPTRDCEAGYGSGCICFHVNKFGRVRDVVTSCRNPSFKDIMSSPTSFLGMVDLPRILLGGLKSVELAESVGIGPDMKVVNVITGSFPPVDIYICFSKQVAFLTHFSSNYVFISQ